MILKYLNWFIHSNVPNYTFPLFMFLITYLSQLSHMTIQWNRIYSTLLIHHADLPAHGSVIQISCQISKLIYSYQRDVIKPTANDLIALIVVRKSNYSILMTFEIHYVSTLFQVPDFYQSIKWRWQHILTVGIELYFGDFSIMSD